MNRHTDNKAQSFSSVVKAYQEEMKNLPFVPKGSFGRSVVGADGFPTTMFFGFLFLDHEKGDTFLQVCGLKKRDGMSHVRQKHVPLEEREGH